MQQATATARARTTSRNAARSAGSLRYGAVGEELRNTVAPADSGALALGKKARPNRAATECTLGRQTPPSETDISL